MNKKEYTFEDLEEITRKLRAPNGCPWDREQTHESLRVCMREEAYEVIEAIENTDMENLCEELGDVLLQVSLHSRIGEENKEFTMQDVLNGICEKLIRRHPHVFGNSDADTSEQVIANWDAIKQKEKNVTEPAQELLRIPFALPACNRAQKAQKKAEKAGIELPKAKEKLTQEEVGKQLFFLLNQARNCGIDGEEALSEYTKKFINEAKHQFGL